MSLNESAASLCRQLVDAADRLRVHVRRDKDRPLLIDMGVEAAGGLEAGRRMAEVCLAGLGSVRFAPPAVADSPWPQVMVTTDSPVRACLASQYAGWEVAHGDYFAMGSGPMRAAAGREALFDRIGQRETSGVAVGVLESGQLPSDEVCDELAEKCSVAPPQLTLLVAPTSSQAGTVQVVARSVETAMHKLVELGFDVARVQSGFGVAPLPPVAGDDLTAIGRTNDAILYAAHVTLYVRGDDASLEAIGPQVPSTASADHGRPFIELFHQHDKDFYKMDPLLFSPAVVQFVNIDTGHAFSFGQTEPGVVEASFGTKSRR